MYFTPRGLYRILHDQQGSCCLDIPGLGTPPPDWASRANPTFNGKVYDSYSQLQTFQWTFDHVVNENLNVNLLYHTAREVAPGQALAAAGTPVLFSFPGMANGTQDYHYDPATLIVEPQDESLFQLPCGCAHVLCAHKKE